VSETTTRSQDAAAIMQDSFNAIAARDLEGLTAYWHDDVVEDFVVLGPVRGKEAAEAFFSEMFTAVPDMEFTTERIMSFDGKTAVGQWSLRGTLSGGPFQGIEPNGRPVRLRGIDVMEFEDGLLMHNTIYYDGLAFARQLGLLPAEGSLGDRALLAAFNGLTKLKNSLRR